MHSVPKLLSAELDGINAELVEVEADINVGLHSFNVVGLADKAVSEAKERVNSALKNSGIKPPSKENRRITINLAPADIKKVGSRFDIAIALAYLLASDQMRSFRTDEKLFVGELSLNGKVRPVAGVLSIALLAEKKGLRELFVPVENAEEAAMIKGITVYGVPDLATLIAHLEERVPLTKTPYAVIIPRIPSSLVRFSDIKGQVAAKRALIIAAAGGHNLIMTGPPGTGKTMLAEAFTSILPPPSVHEMREIAQIYSSAGFVGDNNRPVTWRPFRSPHHNASLVAVIGGGAIPKPGEISLAHRGVLFLDEIPEFHRDVLEGLRQPLETGRVHISRSKKPLSFPSRFILLAAMNPCPCGYFGDMAKECTCTAHEILRYQKKLSGPLLDRIDLQITVSRIPIEELSSGDYPENDDGIMQQTVLSARKKQEERFKQTSPRIWSNAEMSSKLVDTFIHLEKDAEGVLKLMLERSFVSARGYYRILKLARTIADIEMSETVEKNHIAEAFQYRLKEGE